MELSLPIYTTEPLYHAIIDLSCCADASHAFELTIFPPLYTEVGILLINFTLVIALLDIGPFKNLLLKLVSDDVALKVL